MINFIKDFIFFYVIHFNYRCKYSKLVDEIIDYIMENATNVCLNNNGDYIVVQLANREVYALWNEYYPYCWMVECYELFLDENELICNGMDLTYYNKNCETVYDKTRPSRRKMLELKQWLVMNCRNWNERIMKK